MNKREYCESRESVAYYSGLDVDKRQGRCGMRTFYSEYVQHCMRFYARHANPKFAVTRIKRTGSPVTAH